jgi:hypothetical protein
MCDPVESGYDGSEFFHMNGCYWNPLTDDGDAFRLAVNLKVDVIPKWGDNCVCVIGGGDHFEESQKPDEFAAMRLAIVRAAAAIGEQMKGNQ